MIGMGRFKSSAFAMQNTNTKQQEYEQESNDLRIQHQNPQECEWNGMIAINEARKEVGERYEG